MNLEAIEQSLRYEWWMNHGCERIALYGDDGEMQCSCHPFVDFKRAPLDELLKIVHTKRRERGLIAMRELTDAGCKE